MAAEFLVDFTAEFDNPRRSELVVGSGGIAEIAHRNQHLTRCRGKVLAGWQQNAAALGPRWGEVGEVKTG